MPRQTAVLLVLFALPAAGASVRFDGAYRLRFNGDTDLTLDDKGFRSAQKQWLEHRLRLTPKVVEIGEETGVEVQASFDILSGVLAGDLASDFRGFGFTERSLRNGLKPEGFDFRHLFAEVRFPFGTFALGQMPSEWGMGMLANSGNGEETADFGDARFGDIVDRALFSFRPLQGLLGPRIDFGRQLTLSVGGDLVYRDRYAQLLVKNGSGVEFGDVAFQVVGMAVYAPEEGTRAGFYVTRRMQSYAASGGDLHAWTFDGWARHAFPLGAGVVLSLEGEAAQIYGGSSHAGNPAPGDARVSQQGAALRATLARGQLEAELEAGYASGDSNPFDDRQSAFLMSRDYKVGMVLFDEVRMFQSQNAARRLSDPALSGTPRPGLDLIPTQGAVSNAVYLKPTVRWRPRAFGGTLRLVGSVLFARAPEPVVDEYQALIASTPLNAFGHTAGTNYGVEVDGAVGWRVRLVDTLGFESGVQAGYLFPGNVFARPDGSRMPGVWATRVRATLVF